MPALVGLLSGSAAAGFLLSLDAITSFREYHSWLLYLLPFAGALVGWIYHRWGQGIESGNNLLIDEFHEPTQPVPLKMAPLSYLVTIITHLFGGSAGREGTAVQMGGSLADQLSRMFGLSQQQRKLILICGVSSGFAGVFGTPLTGAIFALEFMSIGALESFAFWPSLVSAMVAFQITLAWGVHHSENIVKAVPAWALSTFLWVALAGVVFGLVAIFFSQAMHGVSRFLKKRFTAQSWAPLARPFVGGLAVDILVKLFAWDRFLGLGVPVIRDSFLAPQPWIDSIGKTIMTALTIGSGMKGGEVTPLFFVGASAGNALSQILPLELSFLTALGFVAVFAGAANAPIACTLMACELFGFAIWPYAAVACTIAYLCSGHSGIYESQRIARKKNSY